ncbi:hypothetical protein BJ322DRAFT_1045554 [Thelephora terrestris]|uniref:DUF6533 domain-containing protein n=1 Tax=Thelephora terrestris TaxID=56493 RepID=A0A9P6L9B5_9AGAM|nr:hypothetical protein BJ322DRAFT_1045554 [Thelephora terrestris]
MYCMMVCEWASWERSILALLPRSALAPPASYQNHATFSRSNSFSHNPVQGVAIAPMDVVSENVQEQNLNRYLALCGFTLVLYDYILTFHAELDRFWSPLRIRQWGTFIFIVNRYLGLLGHVPIVYSYFFVPLEDLMAGQQDPKCQVLHKYHQFLAVVVQTSVGAILLTRVYALWDRSRIILWALLAYYFGFAGFAVWAITQGKPAAYPLIPPDSLGCVSVLSKDEGFYFGLVWGGIMIFDSTVFALTVYRSLALWRQGSRGLVHILMRDGVVYYAALGCSTSANTFSFLLGSALTRGINTLMTNMLACALCSRLMLNLRDPRINRYQTETGSARDSPSCAEPFSLTTVVMNDLSTFQTGEEARSADALGVEVVRRA